MQHQSMKDTIQTTLDSVMPQKYKRRTCKTLTSWLEDSHVKRFLMQEKDLDSMTQEERSFLKSQGFSETKNQDIFYSKTLKAYYLMTKEILSRQCFKYSPTWGMMFNGRYIIAKTTELPKTGSDCILKDFLERERCPREILPISGASTETDARHGQIAPIPLNDKKQAQRVYSTDGVSPTLCANGGGDGGKTGLYLIPGGTRVAKVDSERYVPCTTEGNMFTIMTRHRDMKFEKRQDNYVCRKNNNQYSIRRLTPIECERLQGFPDNWTKYGVDDELISDTQRYKCCGNAVTVNVVRDIMNDWNILEEKEDLE